MSNVKFDWLAPWYDGLNRLVYGRSMRQAQTCFFGHIKDGQTVLILGGGTGWILDPLLKNKRQCQVWYIDISPAMIERSKRRTVQSNQVTFITGTDKEVPSDIFFDVIITNFYLDLFTTEKLSSIIAGLVKSMKSGGEWIATDFVTGKKLWHKVLLKTMYYFFVVTCKIETMMLPEWKDSICKAGLQLREEKYFFRGFIKAARFAKPS